MRVVRATELQAGQLFLYGDPLRAYVRDLKTYGEDGVKATLLYADPNSQPNAVKLTAEAPVIVGVSTDIKPPS